MTAIFLFTATWVALGILIVKQRATNDALRGIIKTQNESISNMNASITSLTTCVEHLKDMVELREDH